MKGDNFSKYRADQFFVPKYGTVPEPLVDTSINWFPFIPAEQKQVPYNMSVIKPKDVKQILSSRSNTFAYALTTMASDDCDHSNSINGYPQHEKSGGRERGIKIWRMTIASGNSMLILVGHAMILFFVGLQLLYQCKFGSCFLSTVLLCG